MGARRRKGLIVDGYNVIRSTDKYRALVDEEILDPLLHDVYIRARQALVADVAAFAKGRYEAVVVFDGFGNPDPNREARRVAGIDVVFSEEGEEADAVIERLVSEGRREGRPMTVVTSDALVQNTVMGDHVTRMSSRAFAGETAQMNRRIEEQRENPAHRKSTVADRIPDDVRHKLWMMSRGLAAPGASDAEDAPGGSVAGRGAPGRGR